MKNIKYSAIIFAIIALMMSCENDGGTSVIPLDNGAMPNFILIEGSPDFIVNTTFADLNLEFKVDVSIGNPKSFDLRALYKTIDGNIYGPVTLDSGVTSFPKDYVISGSEIINAFSEINSSADMNAGDNIIFFTSFVLQDGRVINVLNNQGDPSYYAADFDQIGGFVYFLAYPVVCAPQPGIYTIDMHDSFGDGWQTNDPNGGNGIQLILDGVVIDEVGMCSPYQASPYEGCVEGDFYDASVTVTIPEGTEVASWMFPGDAYGEIGFEVYGPNGELLLTSDFGEAGVGPLTVILCAE
jgi:hypothetical protein